MSKKQAGFTLGEIMIALGLLSIILTALIGVLTSVFAMQDGSEEDVAAANLARTIMDEWKSRPYAEIEALIGNPPPSQTRQVDGRHYECEVQVQRLTPASVNPNGEVLTLTVSLGWLERSTASGAGRTERRASLDLGSAISPGGGL